MANSDEFTLIPPRMVQDSDNSMNFGRSPRSAGKLVEFRVLQPDNTVHELQLPDSCTGNDCIDQICAILGIVEKDYFGLKFIDKSSGYKIWINKRLRMLKQLKSRRPPHVLYFCIKYYTQPQYLLQSTSIDAFFMDLKYQIARGDILIPNPKKAVIGAHIAQTEMGDFCESSGVVYPPYFPTWDSGISHIIRKEHRKLKGVTKRDAQVLFIMNVYELETYGVTYVQAIINGERVRVGLGAKYIRLFTQNWRCKSRISFSSLTQVAFGNKFFSFIYCQRDEERNIQEKKITAYVYNHTLAKSLFRSVTEDQVFHYQNTVTPMVMNHADNRETVWRVFCRKVLKMKYEKKYYYDIQRTKKESYRYHWQVLNQVASRETVTEPPEEPPVIYVNLPNHQEEEADEEEDLEKLKKKCEVWWGLSDSSTNLAKELLPSEFVTISPSKEMSFLDNKDLTPTAQMYMCSDSANSVAVDSTTVSVKPEVEMPSLGTLCSEIDTTQDSDAQASDAQTQTDTSGQLNKAQGRKMLRFLMKIQDERLCNVCMDELISSVFCPCGHYVACERCAKRLDKCPVCRQPVGYVQYVYTK